MNTKSDVEKKYKPLVIVLSIIIPTVVALLFNVSIDGVELHFLPPIYASINGITALLLIIAVVSIKQGNKKRHQNFMNIAVACSVLFLTLYVAYHMTSTSTIYGDVNYDGKRDANELLRVGSSYYVYTVILLSHILLSLIVLPLVMMTYLKGWANNLSTSVRGCPWTR